jgi:hypothetical protein
MAKNQRLNPTGRMIILPLVLLNAIIIKQGFIGSENWWWLLLLSIPLLLLGMMKKPKRKPSVVIDRTPVMRRLRYSFESDQRERRIRRHEASQYIRFKIFSKNR